MFTPPRAPCITLPAAITPRGTACSFPPTTSAMSSLYAVKLSLLSASYQTCASRYFSLGPSSAPAQRRTRFSAAAPSHSRPRSAKGRSWNAVTAIAHLRVCRTVGSREVPAGSAGSQSADDDPPETGGERDQAGEHPPREQRRLVDRAHRADPDEVEGNAERDQDDLGIATVVVDGVGCQDQPDREVDEGGDDQHRD